jgi:hypothetical protein
MIPTPHHGSFPSGHATEAHAVARVLFHLVAKCPKAGYAGAVAQLSEQMMRQAARIAINRTVAGMHYPVDSMAGQTLGFAMAEYFMQRCGAAEAKVAPVTLDAALDPGIDDFSGTEIYNPSTGAYKAPTTPAFYTRGTDVTVAVSTVLKWLWDQAVLEWN